MSNWLNALTDGAAGLQTTLNCLRLIDFGDGDSKLVVADLGTVTMKLYKGTDCYSVTPLTGVPAALAPVTLDGKTMVAAACGLKLYIFEYLPPNHDGKQGASTLRPFQQYTIPYLAKGAETEVCNKVLQQEAKVQDALDLLLLHLDAPEKLTATGRHLAALDTADCSSEEGELEAFHASAMETASISCLESMGKSLVLVGTQDKQVAILDISQKGPTSIKQQAEVHSTPSFLAFKDVWTNAKPLVIFAACEDGNIALIEGNTVTKQITIGLPILGLVHTGPSIVVGCEPNILYCFGEEGGEQKFAVELPANTTAMGMLTVKKRTGSGVTTQDTLVNGVVVATQSGAVQVYHGMQPVSEFNTDSPVTAMRFGVYGTEEHTCCMVLADGTLLIKMVSRNAPFTEKMATTPAEEASQTIQKLVEKSNLAKVAAVNGKLDASKQQLISVSNDIRSKQLLLKSNAKLSTAIAVDTSGVQAAIDGLNAQKTQLEKEVETLEAEMKQLMTD